MLARGVATGVGAGGKYMYNTSKYVARVCARVCAWYCVRICPPAPTPVAIPAREHYFCLILWYKFSSRPVLSPCTF